MINEADIDLMADWRDEMTTLRQRDISVIYAEVAHDEFTNEPIGVQDVTRDVIAVVTEISSAIPDNYLANGVEYKKGDIKADVNSDLIADIIDKITKINYDSKDYEILAIDKKGIGRRNRFEILGRVIT